MGRVKFEMTEVRIVFSCAVAIGLIIFDLAYASTLWAPSGQRRLGDR